MFHFYNTAHINHSGTKDYATSDAQSCREFNLIFIFKGNECSKFTHCLVTVNTAPAAVGLHSYFHLTFSMLMHDNQIYCFKFHQIIQC